MLRFGAAAAAIAVSLAIFGVALATAWWLLGSGTLGEVLSARWFPVAVIGFNGLLLSLLLVVLTLRRRHQDKATEASGRAGQESGKPRL